MADEGDLATGIDTSIVEVTVILQVANEVAFHDEDVSRIVGVVVRNFEVITDRMVFVDGSD